MANGFLSRLAVPFFPLLLAASVTQGGESLPKSWFEENYTKREHRIPMRDGVKLYTVVFSPKDGSTNYPILLQRTPYNLKPYTVDAARKPGQLPAEHMVEDQRFAARRPDVLVYQTEPLTEDVTIAGPLTASLHVSTTGTDTDWVVKLIDVYTADHPDPDPNPTKKEMGHYQQLVRGEPLRGKFRDGRAHPKPFAPGQITQVEWELPDICHTFRAGHCIMVQVQSSWFPLMDRNPQTYCDIYRSKPDDYRKATQRVYRTVANPSALRVNVLPAPAPGS